MSKQAIAQLPVPLKAFAVLEHDENTGMIYFARSDIEARKAGANEFADGDLSGVSCRRASWADEYADGQLPAKVMIAHGWHFECVGCGSRIDEDWLHDEDLILDGVIGSQHGPIFCSEICQAEDNLRDAVKRDKERRAIAALKAFVLKRFPSVEFADKQNWSPRAYARCSDGSWSVDQVVVSFNFPGMKIGAASCHLEFSFREIGPIFPHFTCCGGDKETFQAWVASPESREKPAGSTP